MRKVGNFTVYHNLVEDLSVFRPGKRAKRVYATVIDLFFQSSLVTLVRLPFYGALDDMRLASVTFRYDALMFLLATVAFLAYTVIPLAMSGQTLGKRVFGVRVVRGNFGTTLHLSQLVIRETVGKILTLCTFGIPINGKRAHEWLTDTRTIEYR
jgi:uncharacterized RDD family membrane protein YckC